ncbi:MAG: hypothetical protein K9H64_19785 [Bacteroidales bacterium]|nr:hypothetical protein [Bacteroidales bacterium]MCF8458296.1 hypothetical protein [Bacteroidales bacterium]
MRNFKLFMVLILALGLTATSCKKDEDSTPVSTFKGSVSLIIDGVVYDKLTTEIYQVPEGVTFYLEDNNGGEFQIAIAPVMDEGVTTTLSLALVENEPTLMLADGPIAGYIALIGGAGTITRTSNEEYEIDATLYGGDYFTDMFTITGTIHVGQFGF